VALPPGQPGLLKVDPHEADVVASQQIQGVPDGRRIRRVGKHGKTVRAVDRRVVGAVGHLGRQLLRIEAVLEKPLLGPNEQCARQHDRIGHGTVVDGRPIAGGRMIRQHEVGTAKPRPFGRQSLEVGQVQAIGGLGVQTVDQQGHHPIWPLRLASRRTRRRSVTGGVGGRSRRGSQTRRQAKPPHHPCSQDGDRNRPALNHVSLNHTSFSCKAHGLRRLATSGGPMAVRTPCLPNRGVSLRHRRTGLRRRQYRVGRSQHYTPKPCLMKPFSPES
jgi:hypothetical protein